MKEWEKGWKIILYSDNCPDEFSGDCEYNRETDIDHVKCSEDICPRKPDASKQPVEADTNQRCTCPNCGQTHPYKSDGKTHDPCAA